jgi:phosphoglycolate phosphatase-like HAD superfamily hydrolase
MKLVMFDVDGTLVKGNGIDDICYCEAIADILGVDSVDTDWSHYSRVTDSGITAEIIEKSFNKMAEVEVIAAVRESYLTKLYLKIKKNPGVFREIPGAGELITRIRSSNDICLSAATGGWRKAALLKLEDAGIPIRDIPMASSDDSYDRLSLMLTAEKRALEFWNCPEFEAIWYIADHANDYVNSKTLGYGFVGVGKGKTATALQMVGADYVIPDFTDIAYFFKVLGGHVL